MQMSQFEPAPGTCTPEFDLFLRQNTHSVPIETVANMLLSVMTLENPKTPQGTTMRTHLGEPLILGAYRRQSCSNSTRDAEISDKHNIDHDPWETTFSEQRI